MTLVVAVTGPESIWLLADRRLSFAGRPPKDDGRKVMFLETADGVAIFGYAGLGATAGETEPADWMSRVLRGRNLPLEQSLAILAGAMQRELPRHMLRMPGKGAPGHHVIIPAFVGDEPRLYSIDLNFASDRKSYNFRYTRHMVGQPSAIAPRPPRLAIGGSGALHLKRDTSWIRKLLRVANACDRSKISPRPVADHLAALNNDAHHAVTDVGPRCIVAWRYRKGGVHDGGGGHQFYTGSVRDPISLSLPTITRGADLSAIVGAIAARTPKKLEAMLKGEPAPDVDVDDINAALARLPREPNEDLR